MNTLMERLLRDGSLASLKTRPARALIGWMPEREALTMLAIPLVPATPSPEHVNRVREAHAAVRSRPSGVDQTHVLSDIGAELREYVAEFQQHPTYKQYVAGGCTIRIANLNQLCALQPVVHVDYLEHSERSRELTEQAVQRDMLSLMRITLPISEPAELPVQFDQQRNAWVLQSRSPDTRIVGNFSARVELAPGLFGMGYGFCIALLPSFVQVVLYRGRYFLKDGYHRSLALLERGITHIPVIFQEISESQNLELEGRLPDDMLLGPRPPRLPDYFNQDVAAAGFHLTSQKTIMIRSMEDRTWG